MNKYDFLLPPHFISGSIDRVNKLKEYNYKTNLCSSYIFPQAMKTCNFLENDMALLTSNSPSYDGM